MDPKYIRVASDLHLEGFMGRDPETLVIDFLPSDPRDAESVLVLAGDISSKPDQIASFLSVVAKKFQHVIYLPGNHEYYKHNMKAWDENLQHLIPASNVAWTNGVGTIEFEKVRFIFSIMWADGGKDIVEQTWVDRGLNDFRLIRRADDTRFTVRDMVKLHKDFKAKIAHALKQPFNGKTVVATHHMPSYRLCDPRFGTDINGGFAANCDDLLTAPFAPALWIHGHTHDTTDHKLWETRIVCNPAGYRSEYNTSYNQFMVRPKFIAVEEL
jgi:hypothetical protein